MRFLRSRSLRKRSQQVCRRIAAHQRRPRKAYGSSPGTLGGLFPTPAPRMPLFIAACRHPRRAAKLRYLSLSEKIGRRCPYGTLGRECSKNGSAWIEPGGTASRRQLIWLAALAGREELIISSAIERVCRSGNADQNRQSEEGDEDRLHGCSPICHSVVGKWGLRLRFAVIYGTSPLPNGLRVAAP